MDEIPPKFLAPQIYAQQQLPASVHMPIHKGAGPIVLLFKKAKALFHEEINKTSFLKCTTEAIVNKKGIAA